MNIFRKLEQRDLDSLPRLCPDFRHTAFSLQTIFGYSRSEMEVVIAEQLNGCFVVENEGHIKFILSVTNTDVNDHHGRLQVYGDIKDCVELVRSNLETLISLSNIRRLYSFTRMSETVEKKSLALLGFHHEGILREHIYSSGNYESLEIHGCSWGR